MLAHISTAAALTLPFTMRLLCINNSHNIPLVLHDDDEQTNEKKNPYLVYLRQMWTSNSSAFNRFVSFRLIHNKQSAYPECFRLKANKNERKKISFRVAF